MEPVVVDWNVVSDTILLAGLLLLLLEPWRRVGFVSSSDVVVVEMVSVEPWTKNHEGNGTAALVVALTATGSPADGGDTE